MNLSDIFSITNIKNHKVFNLFGLKIKIKRKKKVTYKNVTFKTFQSLATLIRQNVQKLPNDIDLIVGIPRSGVIPAYIIALFLNKKVMSLNEFICGYAPSSGARAIEEKEIKNILIVDDSIGSGKQMQKTLMEIKEKIDTTRYNIKTCAIFARKSTKDLIDYFFELVEYPRLFQWNYLNHSIAEKCCFDIDGVLCSDPTSEQNDDGEKYKDFILHAKPLFIPQYEIYALVTSRLEKYRKETELWLKKNGVKYKHLYMLNLNSAEERQKLNCHASFKAEIYKNLDETVCFIESEPNQAKIIAELSGKQCICTSTDEYFIGKK